MSKKYLIIYFSRTERTKKVAEYLQNQLNADYEEIVDKKSYKGVIGYIKGIFKAKSYTEICATRYNPSYYDELIIMSPVWAGTFAPAIRTYIRKNSDNIKLASLITTASTSNCNGAKKEMESFNIILNKALYINKIKEDSLLDLKEKLLN